MNIIRKLSVTILVFVACAGVATGLHADNETIQLKLNLKEGEVYNMAMVGEASGSIEVPLLLNGLIYPALGIEQVETIQNKWLFTINDCVDCSLKILNVDPEGNSTVDFLSKGRNLLINAELPGVVKFECSMILADGKVAFTVLQNGQEILRREGEVVESETVNVTLAPNGKIIKCMGLSLDQIVDEALALDENESIDSTEIKKFISSCLDYYAYPSQPLKIGDSWDHKIALNLPLDQLAKEEGITCDPLNVEIASDTTVIDVVNRTVSFKTKLNTTPANIKWGLKVENFDLHLDFSCQSESQMAIDLDSGMPLNVASAYLFNGKVTTSLPFMAEDGGKPPVVTVPIDMKGTTKITITKKVGS